MRARKKFFDTVPQLSDGTGNRRGLSFERGAFGGTALFFFFNSWP